MWRGSGWCGRCPRTSKIRYPGVKFVGLRAHAVGTAGGVTVGDYSGIVHRPFFGHIRAPTTVAGARSAVSLRVPKTGVIRKRTQFDSANVLLRHCSVTVFAANSESDEVELSAYVRSRKAHRRGENRDGSFVSPFVLQADQGDVVGKSVAAVGRMGKNLLNNRQLIPVLTATDVIVNVSSKVDGNLVRGNRPAAFHAMRRSEDDSLVNERAAAKWLSSQVSRLSLN